MAAFLVLMPEAAVNEDHDAARPQNNVGLAGELRVMQAVANAKREQRLSNNQFRLRVRAFDTAHVFASALTANVIGHVRRYLPLESASPLSRGPV